MRDDEIDSQGIGRAIAADLRQYQTTIDAQQQQNRSLIERLNAKDERINELRRRAEAAEARAQRAEAENQRHEVFMRAIKDCRDDPASAIAANDIINGKAIIAAHAAESALAQLREQVAKKVEGILESWPMMAGIQRDQVRGLLSLVRSSPSTVTPPEPQCEECKQPVSEHGGLNDDCPDPPFDHDMQNYEFICRRDALVTPVVEPEALTWPMYRRLEQRLEIARAELLRLGWEPDPINADSYRPVDEPERLDVLRELSRASAEYDELPANCRPIVTRTWVETGPSPAATPADQPHMLTEYGTTDCPVEGVRAFVDDGECSACGAPVAPAAPEDLPDDETGLPLDGVRLSGLTPVGQADKEGER